MMRLTAKLFRSLVVAAPFVFRHVPSRARKQSAPFPNSVPCGITRCSGLLAAAFLWAALAPAATTSHWEINNYPEFLKGKLNGVSLSREGRITLAPRMDTLSSLDQPVIWAIAAGAGNSLFLATGHRGQVFRIDSAGKSELVWTAPEPEVFTLAVDPKGALYAATAPDGKIYRITLPGRPGTPAAAVEYFNPQSKYIWSLAVARDGVLYAGTGDQGKIFRITGQGAGEVWYESGQTHITSLAIDAKGRLLAGSEPNGILYDVLGKDKAFVLYDANLPEIRAIVPAPDGSLYVAALGGAYGKKQAGAAGAATAVGSGVVVTAPTTTITVEAAQAQGGEVQPKPEQAKTSATATVTSVTPLASSTPVLELTGVDKSAVYRIHPDNLVETLFVSKEENIYDLVPQDGRILFSTDGQGRVYRLEPNRQPTLLVETREGEATRLTATPDGVLVATSHAAKLLRLGSQYGAKGEYESPVHDASNAARWGRLTWVGKQPQGVQVSFRTRSGNSARPDKTWSDWSAPLTASGSPVSSPNARYIQWRAELSGTSGASPELDSVTLAYLPQNTPPVVKSVNVTSQGGGTPKSAAAAAATAASNTVYSVTVSDGGDTQATSSGSPAQTVTRPSSGQLVVTWQAEDTDGDKLLYTVWFRGEEESEWKLLRKDWPDLALTLEADSLADGRYLFRVEATDASANPAPQARTGELISAPILLDNTPPSLTPTATRSAAGVELAVTVSDAASSIRRAEVSVNAGPWVPLAAEDGVADSRAERFIGRVAQAPTGELVVAIRAFDAAGNAGVAKLVVR